MKTRITAIWHEQKPLLLLQRLSVRPTAASPRPPLVCTVASSASTALLLRRAPSALARRFRSSRFTSHRFKSQQPRPPHADPTPHLGSPEPAPSLSQRLKQLSREYGWTAVGVYFGLSLLDFPFCFLAVRLLGTERIGHYEDVVRNTFWSLVRIVFPRAGEKPATAHEVVDVDTAASQPSLGLHTAADATIWTQLGLAYLVHKSLIFFRVPLTAAVLPQVVKTLRNWGYNIGKRKAKTA